LVLLPLLVIIIILIIIIIIQVWSLHMPSEKKLCKMTVIPSKNKRKAILKRKSLISYLKWKVSNLMLSIMIRQDLTKLNCLTNIIQYLIKMHAHRLSPGRFQEQITGMERA